MSDTVIVEAHNRPALRHFSELPCEALTGGFHAVEMNKPVGPDSPLHYTSFILCNSTEYCSVESSPGILCLLGVVLTIAESLKPMGIFTLISMGERFGFK